MNYLISKTIINSVAEGDFSVHTPIWGLRAHEKKFKKILKNA